MDNRLMFMSALFAVALTGIFQADAGAEMVDRLAPEAEQAGQDTGPGYRVAEIKGDDLCRPPKDYNAAGYARPIDVLGTLYEPTGREAQQMKQWSCSYQRPDGTIVQFGSSFTPLEQWRSSVGDKE